MPSPKPSRLDESNGMPDWVGKGPGARPSAIAPPASADRGVSDADGYLGRYFGHGFLPAAFRLTDKPGHRLDYEVGHGGVPLDCHSAQMLKEFRWHPGTQLLSCVAFSGRHYLFAFRFYSVNTFPLYLSSADISP